MGSDTMKYWKGKPNTIKKGQVGTMDNNGFVPNSIEITESEYQDYVNSLPPPESIQESDIDKLIEHAKKEKWID